MCAFSPVKPWAMGDIARCSIGKPTDRYNEELLYKAFGVNAELLIDHAWGYDVDMFAQYIIKLHTALRRNDLCELSCALLIAAYKCCGIRLPDMEQACIGTYLAEQFKHCPCVLLI